MGAGAWSKGKKADKVSGGTEVPQIHVIDSETSNSTRAEEHHDHPHRKHSKKHHHHHHHHHGHEDGMSRQASHSSSVSASLSSSSDPRALSKATVQSHMMHAHELCHQPASPSMSRNHSKAAHGDGEEAEEEHTRISSKLVPHPDFVQNARAGSKQSAISIESQEAVNNLLKEIAEHYPCDEFEMTAYTVLPRFRPGEHITLQDFTERKALNGMEGKCIDHDPQRHVWTILLHNGQKIRVLPPAVQKALMQQNADNLAAGKPVAGFFSYGHDIVPVSLNTEHVALHRHVREHVIRPQTPPKVHHKDDHAQQPKPKAKRKAKAKAKHHDDDEEGGDHHADTPFEIGDMVTMKHADGQRLGVGTVKEKGNREGMVKVEFGNRGGAINIEVSELQRWTRSRKSAKQHRPSIDGKVIKSSDHD